ncbi:DUF6574 domain-containing protein [Lacticaseibacillus mingshuiensis]|uniref:DUF6574 domain-containing protein n=1 Tax=Lacticaseibacillus mingshuiensis TaxID=2799574 RepID=A0ABW4CFQ3_9LACO|nr:DUF6574 domain-containing protein [Lacticaseibacillus mingshuiensis]
MLTCPNCGKLIPADSKFCTYCGYQLTEADRLQNATPAETQPAASETAAQATGDETTTGAAAEETQAGASADQAQAESSQADAGQTAAPEQPVQGPSQPQYQQAPAQPNPTAEKAKAFTKGYWAFLVSSLKHPYTLKDQFHKYFGFTTLIVESLFMALAVLVVEHSYLGATTSAFDQIAGTNSTSSLSFAVFFQGWIMFLAILFVIASVAYLTSYAVLGDRRLGYLDSLTQFAHFSNLAVFGAVLSFLVALIARTSTNMVGFAMTLLVISLALGFMAFTVTIFKSENNTKLDRVYAYLIGTVILSVALWILFAIFKQLFMSQLSSMTSNLLHF